MKSHARVAVIGGGVVGCSVLYHLTVRGWADVVLLERAELTSGSSWHAAGGMHTLNSDPNVAKLQEYTIGLYKEIEAISGQSCGIHPTGGIYLAATEARMDWLRNVHGRGRYLGLNTEIVTPDEAAALFPLLDKRHFVGAFCDRDNGHVDPAGVTNAYAGAARKKGAEIYRQTRVTELHQRADGTWDVVTDQGSLQAEHVVNAGGLWAREVGRMAGLELPVLAMEHQYIITEDMPEVVAHDGELMHAIDLEAGVYIRHEGNGMLMGTYEKACKPWSPRQTPWDFGPELLASDIDRIAPSLERVFEHFPALARAGIKDIINGPFTFTPDGNPLVGPVRGLSNHWLACGVMAGFSQGGGVGLALANWIVDGDPQFDVWAMDAARFGDWTTPAFTNAKVRENYSRRFQITFPNEELPAGRPLRTTPIHGRLKALNAVFGAAYGLESALWFAPEGSEPVEDVTFRRSNAHGPVGDECRAVRDGVGLIETTSFAKYAVEGPAAEDWLSHVLANRMPRQGRIVLSPMLNPAGKLIGDFTVARLGPERFLVIGSGVAEEYHLRWFERHLPESGVRLRSLSIELAGLSIAGPRSRDLLTRLCAEDVSNEAFPFLAIRETSLGIVPAIVGRISYTGDLGYEFWCRSDFQAQLYDQVVDAGADLGLRYFGVRALNGLRLEKSYGSWAREYRPIYGPFAAGLGRFVALDKADFIGRSAALAEQTAGPERRLVTLVIDDSGIDVSGDEAVWHGNAVVGWVTSGGFAHCSDKSVALAYVPADRAGDEGVGAFQVEILGDRPPATIAPRPLFDPDGTRMRS